MSSRDIDLLARKLVTLEKQVKASTRASQLPDSSVRISEDESYDLAQTVGDSVESVQDVVTLTENTESISNQIDAEVDSSTAMSEWVLDTGYNLDAAWEASQIAAENVDIAMTEAAEALDKAASAQMSADGKNARRRGVTEPDPPEGGWVQGDQWIRDVEQPGGGVKAVEALVWNGTEFVPEQTLATELLVLGENGDVRIADGKVTAQALAVDALDFKVANGLEINAGKFVGGSFMLADAEGVTPVLYSDCEVIDGWTAGSQSSADQPILSNDAFKGNHSVSCTATEGAFFAGSFGPISQMAYAVSARVKVSAQQEVRVFFADSMQAPSGIYKSLGVVEPGEWNYVEVVVPWIAIERVGFIGTQPGSTLLVDELAVFDTSDPGVSGMAIGRDVNGRAMLSSYSGDVVTKLIDGQIRSTRFLLGEQMQTIMEPSAFSASGVGDRKASLGVGFEDPALKMGHGGGRSGSLEFDQNGYFLYKASGHKFTGTLEQPGNVFALKSQLNAWAAIDGTHAWVTSESEEYVRVGGKWLLNPAKYYNAGDKYLLSVGSTQVPMHGVVSGGNKDIYVTIPLARDVAPGVQPVVRKAWANARGGNGGYWTLGNYVNGGYNVTGHVIAAIVVEGAIQITLRHTANYWSTNNMSVSIDFSLLEIAFV